MNVYQGWWNTAELKEKYPDMEVNANGEFLLYFDTIKLILYSLYFGKQQLNDVLFFKRTPSKCGP